MILFFVLWRCGLIGLLGLAISQLYGWQPSSLLIGLLVAIAVDTVATLHKLKG